MPIENIRKYFVGFKNHLTVFAWLFLVIICGLAPLISELLFRIFTGIDDPIILPSCKGYNISYVCLKNFFLNGLGYVFLTVSLTGSLFIDVIYDASLNKDTFFLDKKGAFYSCLAISIFCFCASILIAVLNPITLFSLLKKGNLNVNAIFKTQTIIFIMAFMTTFFAKKKMLFN